VTGAPPTNSNAGAPDPLLGAVVAGKYRVRKAVARGGMGRIYRAVQEPLGREVALKILTRPLLGTDHDAEALQKRFFLEAATCARLRHPNTVSVFDYGALDVAGEATFFMVMEFVAGQTLSQVLRSQGPLSAARVARVMHEIARSLREAHGEGVVHRDLKPSNVMLVATDEGESVKVLDFGVAKVLAAGTEALTTDGNFVGSPRYTSPEQVRQETVDGRADLYALGVVAWELLTGAAPFSSPEPMRTLLMQLNDPLPEFRPAHAVPEALEGVVRRLLAKDPAARFADADALIAALRPIRAELGERTAELPVPAEAVTLPTSTLNRAPVATGRMVLALGVAAAGALVMLVSVGVAAIWWVGGPGTGPQAAPPAAGGATPADVLAAPVPGPADPGGPSPAALASVRIVATPGPAEVWVDGVKRGETPFDLGYDPDASRTLPLKVELRRSGHRAAAFEVSGLDEDGRIEIALSPVRKPVPDKGGGKATPGPSGDDIRLER
jgi:serine/threonine-protein kinase